MFLIGSAVEILWHPLYILQGLLESPKGLCSPIRISLQWCLDCPLFLSCIAMMHFLSVLPLHHTFEFSAGLLMPLVHGASVTYLDEVDSDGINAAFGVRNITGMVGVPALWNLLHRKVFKSISERGLLWEKAFELLVEANRKIRDAAPYGWNLGKILFYPVHRKLGGRQRLLISGGSALSPDVLQSFRGLGFKLVEGYGMTEASPVITVMRPNETPTVGSVGRALPGVDVQIYEPDKRGVGEVIGERSQHHARLLWK